MIYYQPTEEELAFLYAISMRNCGKSNRDTISFITQDIIHNAIQSLLKDELML